jgi:hypothetical protein
MYVYVDRDVSRQDLGTCENPEEAMKETQRALAILSGHVNVGIESVMSLEQYEDSKKLILNNNKYKEMKKGIIALVFTLITSPFLHKLFSINSTDKTMLLPLS